jgi:hypothetical protein
VAPERSEAIEPGIVARITALPTTMAADPVLLRRGRYLNTTCLLDVGDAAFLLRIVDGRVVEARPGPFVTPSADFTISGEPAIWRRFLAAEPPPGDHDLLAFVKRNELRLVGNLHPLMSHLLYFKGVLACLREPQLKPQSELAR